MYAHATRFVQLADEVEHDLKPRRGQVEGTVRVAVPVSALDQELLGHIAGVLDRQPRLRVQLVGTHGAIDAVADAVDVEVFVGRPAPSRRVARLLGHVSWVLAASQRYLERHGCPQTPAELQRHRCLRLLSDRSQDEWQLIDGRNRSIRVPVGGAFECNDSRALGEAVHAGVGIGVRPARDVERAAGSIVRVLPEFRFGPQPVFALTVQGRHRIPRVALVVEMLGEALRERLEAGSSHSPRGRRGA